MRESTIALRRCISTRSRCVPSRQEKAVDNDNPDTSDTRPTRDKLYREDRKWYK